MTAPTEIEQTADELGMVLAELAGVVGNITDEQLRDPTPCTEYDVGQLQDHVLGWLTNFADGFADPAGRMSANGIHATVYQVNQGADQWHILLAWHYHGSLYTVSQHVINPYDSATRIRQNLAHLLKSLVLVQPQQG